MQPNAMLALRLSAKRQQATVKEINMPKTAAVIMAAGKGTRMKSSHAKASFKVALTPMIKLVADTARSCGADRIIAVVGHREDEIRAILGDSVTYAVQTELLGTGDAVARAAVHFGDADECVILSGDAPLLRAETLQKALEYHRSAENSVTVFTTVLSDGAKYGRIIRDAAGGVAEIIEYKDATEAQRAICEINGGMYIFNAAELSEALKKINNKNAQGEYYLTDAVRILKDGGKKAGAFVLEDAEELLGVNDRLELANADKIMRMRINTRHAKNGVTFQNIENTYIAPEAEIGEDAEILNGCIIEGKTVIGEGCTVGPNTHLNNVYVGKNTSLDNTAAKDSMIGSDCAVGPFAYIRPGSCIGDGCKVGDFVEIKNSVLGSGTKVSHLTYVGDSDVGEKVNFGCGTVTVNYDGKKKHRTKIGNRAFIGCNTNLVSPVTVEDGAYIAAGSTITDTVPEKSLAIARARQVVKHGWKDKRDAE